MEGHSFYNSLSIDSQADPKAALAVLGHFRRPCCAAGEEDAHGVISGGLHTDMVAGHVAKLKHNIDTTSGNNKSKH